MTGTTAVWELVAYLWLSGGKPVSRTFWVRRASDGATKIFTSMNEAAQEAKREDGIERAELERAAIRLAHQLIERPLTEPSFTNLWFASAPDLLSYVVVDENGNPVTGVHFSVEEAETLLQARQRARHF